MENGHIAVGSYEVEQINTEIQRQLKKNGDSGITIYPNISTMRAVIEITSATYRVDMTASSIKTTLGFNPQTLSTGYHEGESPVNILSVNSILVHCDIINGSFLNDSREPILISFFPDDQPGAKIVESPQNLVFLPVAPGGNIQRLNIRLTDQNNKQLNLRGETVSIRIHIRSK